jgi:site-specific recombinase XerD
VLDRFIASYREWLSADRGLAATTVVRYENTARRFLRQQFGGEKRVEPATLTGAQVNGFLLAESVRCGVAAAQGRVAELRALLRYLYLRGMTATPLAAAVPPVAGWLQTRIPPTLSSADIASLLATCVPGASSRHLSRARPRYREASVCPGGATRCRTTPHAPRPRD